MCSEDQDIERNEAYVEGHMSDAERHVFEERLGSDSALVDELHAYRVTRKALFDVFMEEHERTALKGNVVRLRTWHWAAAAAVVLLLSGGAWYLLQTKVIPSRAGGTLCRARIPAARVHVRSQQAASGHG
ncbi:MAG: hypothetical protein IPF64_06065 [Flavobacteriales bacterium]|nr:hypothetical protein [Flavobacteriales bacterium]